MPEACNRKLRKYVLKLVMYEIDPRLNLIDYIARYFLYDFAKFQIFAVATKPMISIILA